MVYTPRTVVGAEIPAHGVAMGYTPFNDAEVPFDDQRKPAPLQRYARVNWAMKICGVRIA